MISPTKCNTVRNDNGGDGKYGARRGNRIHKGVDYLFDSHNELYEVVAPISGRVIRTVDPYGDGMFSGLLIQGASIGLKLMYLTPINGVVGSSVLQGELIGHGQDISKKPGYELCERHIHIEADSIDLDIFINKL